MPGITITGVHRASDSSRSTAWKRRRGVPVDEEDTCADALSGSALASAFHIICRIVGKATAVSEPEIAQWIVYMHFRHHQVVEGSGARRSSGCSFGQDRYMRR